MAEKMSRQRGAKGSGAKGSRSGLNVSEVKESDQETVEDTLGIG